MKTALEPREAFSPTAEEAPVTTNKYRILLADDDPEMRALVAWALEREGFILQECHDGPSLKKWVDRSHSRSTNVRFDLVISDIRMPGLTGLEVLEEIQQHHDGMKVVLISAFCDARTEDQARRLGAAALLPKPFEVEDLVDAVKRLLEEDEATPAGRTARSSEEDDTPQIPVEITYRHLGSMDDVELYIQDLTARLERFGRIIHRVRLVIDPLGGDEERGYNLSLIVSTGHRPVVAEVQAGHDEGRLLLRQGLREAFEKVERGLERHDPGF